MRALVTGGAGFIGSHLCRRLISEGFEVICLDNFFTGRKKNVADLLENSAFTLVAHDVVLPFDAEVSRIYDLACPASPVHYQYDSIKTLETSYLGAKHALDLAQKHKARVLLASTSEVYGDPLVHPQVETYWGNVNPIGPRSCYDEGKRVAETLFSCYHERLGTDIRIARIFNTYGPAMSPDDGRVVSNFAVQALRGEPITMYGDGSQTRSFCYVSDLVDGLFRLMESSAGPLPVNLGNPGEFTVMELAEEICRQLQIPCDVRFLPLPKDDPTRRRPNISRAQELLGWQPTIPLREGLVPTIAYFRQYAEAK